jgi:hypothetical protein
MGGLILTADEPGLSTNRVEVRLSPFPPSRSVIHERFLAPQEYLL